jgi:hypothetical protein
MSAPVRELLPPCPVDELPELLDGAAGAEWLKSRNWLCLGIPGSPTARYAAPGVPLSGESYSTQPKIYYSEQRRRWLPVVAMQTVGEGKNRRRELQPVIRVICTRPASLHNLDEALALEMQRSYDAETNAARATADRRAHAEASSADSLAVAQSEWSAAHSGR